MGTDMLDPNSPEDLRDFRRAVIDLQDAWNADFVVPWLSWVSWYLAAMQGERGAVWCLLTWAYSLGVAFTLVFSFLMAVVAAVRG